MSVSNFDNYIKSVPILALVTAISSHPTPPERWTKLYDNLIFRFFFMYIVMLQSTNNHDLALNYTIGIIIFFYIISSPEEKKNNFNFNLIL